MSILSEAFFRALGQPDGGGAPIAFETDDPVAAIQWESALRELRGGRYRDGFLWVLTPGLRALERCLGHAPPSEDRVILARNAYGAIAFADGVSAGRSRVFIARPFDADLQSDPTWDLVGFFAQAIAEEGAARWFVDDGRYARRRATGMRPPLDGEALVDDGYEDLFALYAPGTGQP